MSICEAWVSAYDAGMVPLERGLLGRLRAIFGQAQGRVLEIGAGTGVNLPRYPTISQVTALDISTEMLRAAQRRPARARFVLVQGDGQSLPFPTASFDWVTGSLVFCSLPDPAAALAEIRRVLLPGGRLLLLEHTRGSHPLAIGLTNALNPLWFALNGECRLNRNTARSVAQAGFDLERVEEHVLGIIQVIEARAP